MTFGILKLQPFFTFLGAVRATDRASLTHNVLIFYRRIKHSKAYRSLSAIRMTPAVKAGGQISLTLAPFHPLFLPCMDARPLVSGKLHKAGYASSY